MREEDKKETILHLASVFKGGRISGWVIRNRSALENENRGNIELDLLLQLSPGFTNETVGLNYITRLQQGVSIIVLPAIIDLLLFYIFKD